ncbi:MAG: homocysteine S-methyltransferase family protein [Lachnospiraceae bacterium]|nr:homocysteine S-methyltransferase family protein [Lachnospiraceae bacterium]
MNILDYLKDHFLILDGGMGTLLQEAGLKPGELPERMNLSAPEVIKNIHKAYYDAGSNVVLTNTFGANPLKFDDEELDKIIAAAVQNARAAADESVSDKEKFVALDIGPLGRLLKPYGDLEFEDAVSFYAKIVKVGVKYNPDLIFIETMNDSYDTKAALLAAKENSDLPVFVSNAYGSDGKLMTGATPASMVAMLEGMHEDAIGANCSLGPKQLMGVLEEYIEYASVPVLIKPNAGLPRSVDGKTVYDVLPEEFAGDIKELLKKGVRITGGCCGTRPEYIKAVSDMAKELTPVPVTKKMRSLVSSYTHAVEFGPSPILIGERINPTGKKLFKEALRNNDIDYILGEGLKQQDAGVQLLDVNVGLPEIDEPKMLVSVVKELQAVSDLPLQLDTTDYTAMEQALRCYNGKAMVNSINGKIEVMEHVFPLVKKYGGFVVALTLDEEGIPEDADTRVKIAKRIIDKAKEYGIDKKDLIFDPLAMTISADTTAALSTLEAVYRIHTELQANTSLGVSNVSFGLPERNLVTSVFFANALEKGLSAAIMNPYSQEMMSVYHAFKALHNMDANCTEYIDYASRLPKKTEVKPDNSNASAEGNGNDTAGLSPLKEAVVRGLKEKAGALTKELLNTVEPLTIVQEDIIPALNIVGKGFEEKQMFLPQLLMAAEASKASFEEIKLAMAGKGSEGPKRMSFVIATVHGDIHDIGKNIVKLILENYGFDVHDLGKDVPPEVIVDKAIELHAPVVGLSALMTTTVPAMEETIKQLRVKAPWVKVVVGGAVLTQEYADQIGADKYCKDAMDTVRYAEEVEKSLS